MTKTERRLDAELVARGLASGREYAKEYIRAGNVCVNGVTASKPSLTVSAQDEITCSAAETFVGRGGHKLEKAIEIGGYNLRNVTTLDIGASTGGFTDCMLRHGAATVYAIDVGRGQLHRTLVADPRVCNLEATDIRSPALTDIIPHKTAQFCAIDVAFISVTLIAQYILPFLAPAANIVCLVKPQFESGRTAIGKGGIVRDPHAHITAIGNVIDCFAALGCGVKVLTFSPITGGDGNIEYLLLMRYNSDEACTYPDITRTVNDAFNNLKGADR